MRKVNCVWIKEKTQMSRLRKDMFGDYIYISKNIHPITALYYRNNKMIKSEPVGNFDKYVKHILSVVKNKDNELNKMILNYDVHEVIINDEGVVRFSINGGRLRYFKGE